MSDSREQKELATLNDGLTKLRLLEPKSYKYVDPELGTHAVYGFNAQELKGNLPETVSVLTEAIPDILETCAVSNAAFVIGTRGSVITLTTAVTTNLENKSVRLTDSLGNTLKEQITQIVDSKRFVIAKTFDSTEIPNGTIKVFGTYIADFHSIRKDHLWTLATAATQELDRKVTTLENTISAQQSAIESLQAAVAALQNGN